MLLHGPPFLQMTGHCKRILMPSPAAAQVVLHLEMSRRLHPPILDTSLVMIIATALNHSTMLRGLNTEPST